MDPGWYDDPFHRFEQRYHDGDDWTEHVSDGSGVSFVDPSGTAPFVEGPAPAPPSRSARGPHPAPASIGKRFAAMILDGLLLGAPLFIWIAGEIDWEEVEAGVTPDVPASFYIAAFAVSAAYHIGMVGRWGRTVGKMATGIIIVRASDGRPPGYGPAAVRWLTNLVYGIPNYLGFIVFVASVVMVFASPRRQALHDRTAGTVVVGAPS